MNDEQFLDELNDALDQRLPLRDPSWDAAAGDDPRRREWLDGYRALEQGMRLQLERRRRESSAFEPSADLAAKVLAALKQPPTDVDDEPTPNAAPCVEAPADRIRRTRTWGWALALAAAAAMVAAWPMVQRLANSPADPEERPIAAVPLTPVVPTPIESVAQTPVTPHMPNTAPETTPGKETPLGQDAPIRDLVQQAGSHYWTLAEDTRESLSEVAVLWPRSAEPTEAPAEVEPRGPWIDRVGEQVQPLKRTVDGAVDFLLRSIPLEDAPTL